MRAIALTVLCGCRSILGIEDVEVIDLGDADADQDTAPEAGAVDAGGCPAMYQTLPSSGPRGHRYLQAPASASWIEMRDFCTAVGGFLAFPDGTNAANAQQELSALIAFSGAGTWIGVNDIALEATFRNSLGQNLSGATATFLQGGNTQQNDCASAQSTQFNIEDCANNHKAVCECVP